MVGLTELWLPILVSAAAVWIASALAWMLMPHHKGDWKKLPDEDGFLKSLGALNIPSGTYGFPNMSHADCKDPATKEKFMRGPTGYINIWPANAFSSMGPKMIGSFIVYVVVSVLVAYLCSATLTHESDFSKVFQVAGTSAMMAYCLSRIPNDIWFNTPKRAITTSTVDGIVYGLITGAIFGWLWPHVA
jgi:hypothetical protein